MRLDAALDVGERHAVERVLDLPAVIVPPARLIARVSSRMSMPMLSTSTPSQSKMTSPRARRSCGGRARLTACSAARASSDSSPASVWLVALAISTCTYSPGCASPLKLTALLWRERPRRRVGSVRDGPSTSTSSVRPTKRCARSRGAALDDLDEPLHPLDA